MTSLVDGRVAVVGAGPVGQTVALLLAGNGIQVVLLEARHHPDATGSRSICQQREALDTWSALPCPSPDFADHSSRLITGAGSTVGDRVAAEGVTWSRARTFYRDEELFSIELGQGAWSPYPPFVNISQSRTEEILDEAIGIEELVEVRWGCPVTAVREDGSGVVLETAAGAVRAAYAVICAGGRVSELRSRLGVDFDGESFGERFLICDIRTDLGDWATERRFWFDPAWNPGRQVLIHPCPDSTYRIDWQVPAGFDLAAEEASGALDRRVRAIIGDRPYEVVWRSVYRFSSRVASRLRVGRVLLAGDTAHVFSPFGARGLNSGVADADNLAWKLAYVLRGWAPEDLLESYHAERHTAALENLAVTSATMRFLVPPSETATAYRVDVLTRARTDAAARAQVDSGRLAEPFWYSDSPLTTPSPAHPPTGRPPRGTLPPPAPGTLVPDHPLPSSDPASDPSSEVTSETGRRGQPGSARSTGTGRVGRRLREVARGGLLVLTPEPVTALRTMAEVAPGPFRVVRMDSELAAVLGSGDRETWLVRPDAYVAAVIADPEDRLAAAVRRTLALP